MNAMLGHGHDQYVAPSSSMQRQDVSRMRCHAPLASFARSTTETPDHRAPMPAVRSGLAPANGVSCVSGRFRAASRPHICRRAAMPRRWRIGRVPTTGMVTVSRIASIAGSEKQPTMSGAGAICFRPVEAPRADAEPPLTASRPAFGRSVAGRNAQHLDLGIAVGAGAVGSRACAEFRRTPGVLLHRSSELVNDPGGGLPFAVLPVLLAGRSEHLVNEVG